MGWLPGDSIATGQTPPPYPAGRLRRQLAHELDVKPERLRLNLPFAIDIRPGDILAFDQGRVRQIARLPSTSVQVETKSFEGAEATDHMPHPPGNPVGSAILSFASGERLTGAIDLTVDQLTSETLVASQPNQFRSELLALNAAAEVQRQGKKPWLVTQVFWGRCTMEIHGPKADENLTSPLHKFQLTPPGEEDQPWRLVSREPVAVAFLGETLKFDFSENGTPRSVSRELAIVTEASASVWDKSSRGFTATANGHSTKNGGPKKKKNGSPKTNGHATKKSDVKTADDKVDGREVTVLYGTCRAVISERPSWFPLFGSFVTRTNGVVAVIALGLIAIVALIWLGFHKRLNSATLGFTLIVALLVFLLLGAIDATGLVHYAQNPAGVYGNQRGELRYGLATVTIPEKHVPGNVESPFALYVIRLPEDPDKHFVVKELLEDREAFYRELNRRVGQSAAKHAFVFIHGYNVTFNNAIKRTAQLALDLKFAGAPLCFSWPSQGEVIEYLQDSTNTDVAAYSLAEFLKDVQAMSGAKEIHLIAHSMGNDVLTKALRELGRDYLTGEQCTLNEIVLAAPDIDAQHFERIAAAIGNPRQRMTLYASANDKALNESRRWRGYARAGMAGESLVIIPGVETIDASTLDTDFLGHSYYGDFAVVKDIEQVLHKHATPKDRNLEEQKKGEKLYWRIRQ